jgi:hypothetical protein
MNAPANDCTHRPPTLILPKHNQKSKYRAAWEPWVATNLFMYTVPLAIFLRRARELDFSSGKFDASVQLVQRVFRVFSPELVDALSRIMSGQHSNLNSLVSRNKELLGAYAPPLGPMSMSYLKADMHNLLEEIHMQHKKTMREQDSFDRLLGKVEGLFGQGVVSREEKALYSLLASARLIAQLPMEYKISPRNGSLSLVDGLASCDRPPDRTANGELSETGQNQVFKGLAKCNPADIYFLGNEMRRRIFNTYELGFLVDRTISLSDWLNAKLGIAPGGMGSVFQFNLRFLADYRNLMFAGFAGYILFKFLF